MDTVALAKHVNDALNRDRRQIVRRVVEKVVFGKHVFGIRKVLSDELNLS